MITQVPPLRSIHNLRDISFGNGHTTEGTRRPGRAARLFFALYPPGEARLAAAM